jgi:hypothetical protein
VDQVFVEGDLVYERSKDKKLARLLRGPGVAADGAPAEEKR